MPAKESETKMIANSEDKAPLTRTFGRLTMAVGLAATAGIILSATAAPVRLVGVTSQGDTVLIEATEPVAYSISRPDALSLVVDMRNVSVSDARADVDRQGAITGVRLEQASADDGRALARVHVTLAKPSEYVVRSARNTIRVEVKAAPRARPPPRPPLPRRRPRPPRPAKQIGPGRARCSFPPRSWSRSRRRPSSRPAREHREEPRVRRAVGDGHRAHQVEQDPGRDDRHARRQRSPDADGRHREQGPSAPAGHRLSERVVQGADADGDRQSFRQPRACGRQQPSAARDPRGHGDCRLDELSRRAER